jgi:hypothetical protein
MKEEIISRISGVNIIVVSTLKSCWIQGDNQ